MNYIIDKIYKNNNRNKIGQISSIIAIMLNIILFIFKLGIGLIINSVSIISDAFNNGGDFVNSILSYLGFYISDRPADSDHPYGHGRAEFIASLIIGIVIVNIGIILFKESLFKFINPKALNYNIYGIYILLISILIKLFLYRFNYNLGNRLESPIFYAIAKDSLNDILTTIIALIAIILYPYIEFPIDSLAGMIVSLFIIISGYNTIKDTIEELLGKDNNIELRNNISNYLSTYDRILGVHDLMLHNYGINNLYASCHVEVNSNEDLIEIHEVIDNIERNIKYKYNVKIILHIDPVDINNINIKYTKDIINNILITNKLNINYHDFRIVKHNSFTTIILDIELPYNYKYSEKQILDILNNELNKEPTKYYLIVDFDYI